MRIRARAKEVLVATAVLACIAAGAGALPALARAEVCPNAASRSGPSASLPDCRAYEMVSPVDNEDGNVYTPISGEESLGYALTVTLFPFEAAPDGSAVGYAADPLSAGSGGHYADSYLATRSPGGGWTAVNLEPPGYKETGYQGFSEDLSVGILDLCQVPVLAPEAPSGGYQLLYSHINGDGGGSGYRALITVKPPTQPPGCAKKGIGFGSSPEGERPHPPLYAGGTADLSHLLFEANDALTANATPTDADENNLYDFVDGELRLVNVLPGESHGQPDAAFGSPWGGKGNPSDFSKVISGDGSRIFWSALEPVANINVPGGFEKRPKALYVRENGTETVQVDAAEPRCLSEGKCLSGGGWFWTASSNGENAFFTDCRRLTADSTAVSSGGCGMPGGEGDPLPEARGNDLYEWDEGRLTDLTVDGNASDALGADVQGVLGASENGEYIYFVAGGVLAPGATPAECTPMDPESLCNLYVRHDGTTTFIATLSAADGENKVGERAEGASYGDWQPDLGHRTAEVTPDGRSVVFMSDRSLTGYDNVVNGEAMNEVYVYDAEAEPHLSCASCDPSGAPPPVFFGHNARNASFLPVSGSGSVGGSRVHQPRWISDAGDRVFFDTVEPLVPQDTNGLRDVYEWERDGAGGCQTAEGCIYLLSGGRSSYTTSTEDSSSFIDASASGEDVFIVTRGQLVPQDRNEDYDLYDARVGGVQPLVPTVCSGSGCQGVPSAPPLFATPPSATFKGVGNFEAPPPAPAATKPKARPLTQAQKLAKALRACKTKPKKKRAACRARAKRSYGARSKAKTSKGGNPHV
jgi:hypothetical protein